MKSPHILDFHHPVLGEESLAVVAPTLLQSLATLEIIVLWVDCLFVDNAVRVSLFHLPLAHNTVLHSSVHGAVVADNTVLCKGK